ncbi:endonuclease/exonuclease/phosphatase family protein [Effusibacillus consociatus]|uniref:Endonuclease/exonuclease/phosphatase family protein n=1 Tax=Effusibacillus consociatus TaxID=1117041 RepID=A0ABV9PWV7_9BACL
MKLNVMTFNIHHGRGTDGQLDLNRIIQVLKESEADLIGLNEVDRYFSKRSDYTDQVSWLAEHLQMHHVFGAAITLKSDGTGITRQYGNAFLSRYPIQSESNHLFNFFRGIIEGRALLEIRIEIDQQPVKAYVTHLSLNPLLHKKQTGFILEKIAAEHEPVIVLGDWNMKPGAKAWKKIASRLTDVCSTGSSAYTTFPSHDPKFQLDYIFVSRDFKIDSVDVIHEIPSASDHLPLRATLLLNG